MKKIWNWFVCHILRSHDWTCKASEGIKPDPPLKAGYEIESIMASFHEYAKMYCKQCGKVYHDRIRKV